VRPDKPDVAHSAPAIIRDDQVVLVALDVEEHSVLGDDARVCVLAPGVHRRAPISLSRVWLRRFARRRFDDWSRFDVVAFGRDGL
jgi:hypothetical protein